MKDIRLLFKKDVLDKTVEVPRLFSQEFKTVSIRNLLISCSISIVLLLIPLILFFIFSGSYIIHSLVVYFIIFLSAWTFDSSNYYANRSNKMNSIEIYGERKSNHDNDSILLFILSPFTFLFKPFKVLINWYKERKNHF